MLPLFIALPLIAAVSAQYTDDAKCVAGWNWMYNSQGYDPCYVATQLMIPCYTSYTLEPINLPNGYYVGPESTSESNKCVCSGDLFNLFNACAVCQGGQAPTSFTSWVQDCYTTDITEAGYGGNDGQVPAGVAVPPWALLNANTEGLWNQAEASSIAVGGSSKTSTSSAPVFTSSAAAASTTHATTTQAAVTTTAAPFTSAAPAPTPTPTPAPASSSSNVGAIAGGVVGGVAALVLIGLLIFCLRRRSRKQGTAAAVDPRNEKFGQGPEQKPLGSTNEYDGTPYMSTPYTPGPHTPAPPTTSAVSPAPPYASGAPTPHPYNGLPEPDDPNRYTLYSPGNPATYPQAFASSGPGSPPPGHGYNPSPPPGQGYAPPPGPPPGQGYGGSPPPGQGYTDVRNYGGSPPPTHYDGGNYGGGVPQTQQMGFGGSANAPHGYTGAAEV